MNTTCLICWGQHQSIDCPDRKNEHCQECHSFIIRLSDHTPDCTKKLWIFKDTTYDALYVSQTKPRFIVDLNSEFRVLKDGYWKKCWGGLKLSHSGAIIDVLSDQTFSVSTTSFESIRIAIVVKDGVSFREKLLLLTSKKLFVVAADVDEDFDRDSVQHFTTLVVAVSAEANPNIGIMVFPLKKPQRKFELLFDKEQSKFIIPDEINVGIAQNTENDCLACYGAHHSWKCQRKMLSNCFECHVPAEKKSDHYKGCGVKEWYVSDRVDSYASVLVKRFTVTFKSAIRYILEGEIYKAVAGLKLHSKMADAYFKIESETKIGLYTTGYTRLRIPLVVRERIGSSLKITEKLVFITSSDRTLVAANGHRKVTHTTFVEDYKYNTPLVLYVANDDDDELMGLSVEFFSANGRKSNYEIGYESERFKIPSALDVKSKNYQLAKFDAAFPRK